MKLYQVNDTFRGKRRYESTKGRANWVASIWETELERSNSNTLNATPRRDVSEWIEIRELRNIDEILDALNCGESARI
jgi:hypothetical protein